MENIKDISEISDRFNEDQVILLSSNRDSKSPMDGVLFFRKFECWDSRVRYDAAHWFGIVDKINDDPYTLRYLGEIDQFEESEIINTDDCYTDNKYLITTSKSYQLINPVNLDKPLQHPRYEMMRNLKKL